MEMNNFSGRSSETGVIEKEMGLETLTEKENEMLERNIQEVLGRGNNLKNVTEEDIKKMPPEKQIKLMKVLGITLAFLTAAGIAVAGPNIGAVETTMDSGSLDPASIAGGVGIVVALLSGIGTVFSHLKTKWLKEKIEN